MRAIQASKRQTLQTVLRQFEQWRQNRLGSKRIPEDLWQAAVGLTRRHAVSRVSRDLRLDYYELKDRVNGLGKGKDEKPRRSFVELKVDDPIALKGSKAVVEMEDGKDRRLRIVLEQASGSEVLQWASRFWGDQA